MLRNAIFLFLLCFVHYAQAQKGSLVFESGLAVSAPNTYVGFKQVDMLVNDLSVSRIKGSFGSGFWYGLGLRKPLHKQVEMGLTFSGQWTSQLELENINFLGTYRQTVAKNRQFRLQPYFRIVVPLEAFKLCMKSGLVLPVSTKTSTEQELRMADNPDTSFFIVNDIKYQFTFGYQHDLAIDFKLNEHFDLGISMEMVLLQLRLKRSQVSSYRINDQEQLSTLSTYEREVIYREDLNNFSNNGTYTPYPLADKPMDQLSYSNSFSALSFLLHLTYHF